MTPRQSHVLGLGAIAALIGVLIGLSSPGIAQQPVPLIAPGGQQPGTTGNPLPLPPAPPQPDQPAAQPAGADGVEVLAKGPVHEAFATTAESPTAAPLVKKQPPDGIEELPPDQKPEGDNVQWIPGYWAWEEEGDKFIWISGFWRQPPPGRVWVPGSWRTAAGGWQWAGGFWQDVGPKTPPGQPNPPAPQQIEYLPEPPQTLETGPTVVAPTTTSVYVPGAWVWRGRYVWRPGVWVEYRANWVWVPARYHWTPAGYVFIEGYWDYPIGTRGVLFAPVVFAPQVYGQPTFVYTPVYVVSEPAMMGAMFVRRGHSYYYFGDYYDGPYVDRGYTAWCGTYGGNGFTIGFGVGRAWGYDPLWSYYSVAYRGSPEWNRGMGDLYHGRYRGELMRPPTTLVQQNTAIVNITRVNVTNVTNVTNNMTVVNGAPTVGGKNISGVAVVAPLKVAGQIQRTKFETVSPEARRSEAAAARQIRDVAVQRTRLETAVAQQPLAHTGQPGGAVQPRSIKLDVPKAAQVRAQVYDEKKEPPPAPHKASVSASPGLKIDPPHPEPKTGAMAPGHADPKAQLPQLPKHDSKLPHYDPKAPIGNSKGPIGNPKVDPKHNPPPKGEPARPGPM